MYKLYVESGVNGRFSAFLDILHFYCDIRAWGGVVVKALRY
jgi:hypothetical protein